jgi:hypothetical protein
MQMSLCDRINMVAKIVLWAGERNSTALTYPVYISVGRRWYLPTHIFDVNMTENQGDGSQFFNSFHPVDHIDTIGLIQLVYLIAPLNNTDSETVAEVFEQKLAAYIRQQVNILI